MPTPATSSNIGTTATRRTIIGFWNAPVTISKIMPTSPTDEFTQTVWVRHIYIVNRSGATANILVSDRDTPAVYLISTPLADSGMLTLDDDDGVYMKNGLTWSSSQPNVSVKLAGSLNP